MAKTNWSGPVAMRDKTEAIVEKNMINKKYIFCFNGDLNLISTSKKTIRPKRTTDECR